MRPTYRNIRDAIWAVPYSPVRVTTYSGKSWVIQEPEHVGFLDGEFYFNTGNPERPRIGLRWWRIAKVEKEGQP